MVGEQGFLWIGVLAPVKGFWVGSGIDIQGPCSMAVSINGVSFLWESLESGPTVLGLC